MFFKSMINVLNSTYDSINYHKIDENLIRYFKTEYGNQWKIALGQYLYNENSKKNKKAA